MYNIMLEKNRHMSRKDRNIEIRINDIAIDKLTMSSPEIKNLLHLNSSGISNENVNNMQHKF